MQKIFSSTKWQEEEDVAVEVLESAVHHIIVWNDDVNTFDHVINSLVEICGHNREQAEQCALFVHYKGKYAVKDGAFAALRAEAEALIDRGINATID